MGATLVQKKGDQSSGATASLSVTLDSPFSVGSGDHMGLALVNSDATIATPSGWSLAVSAVSGQGLYIFYRMITGGESATVTFTPDHSTAVAAAVVEYSGILASPLDKTAFDTTSGGSSIATGTTTTTSQADELVIVVIGPHNPTSGTSFALTALSAGYTTQISEPQGLGANPFNAVGLFVADRVVSATGTYAATGTISPNFNDAGAAIATFKATAAGHTIAVGLAVETDTAPAIRPLRTRAIGTALETDSARAIGHSKGKTIGLAMETDTALTISPALSSVIGFDYLAAGRARVGWHAGQAQVNWHAGRARIS